MRCYSVEGKAAAVWVVRALRVELGVAQGMVQRVAMQLGYGVGSVWVWGGAGRHRRRCRCGCEFGRGAVCEGR